MEGLKKRNLIIIAVIVLVIAIVLSSFLYLNFNSQKPYSGKIETITWGSFAHEFNSLVYIANDQQYFSDNGLNIVFKSYPSGLAAANGMLNGEVDISTTSEFVLVQEALKNESLYAFGSVSKSQNVYVVARTDRGINDVSDLKGKTIGVAFGTYGQFSLGRFLDLNGISQSEVTLLNLPFQQQPNALANDTVDAVATFQPYLNQIETLIVNNIVKWSAQEDQISFNEVLCPHTWATAHPDLIVRFLKALIQAESFSLNHKSEAMTIVAGKLNYTSTYMATVWPDYQFTVTLDQSLLLAMQDESRWLLNNNLTNATSVPNFLNYVYLDGLEAVDPNAVTIIH